MTRGDLEESLQEEGFSQGGAPLPVPRAALAMPVPGDQLYLAGPIAHHMGPQS